MEGTTKDATISRSGSANRLAAWLLAVAAAAAVAVPAGCGAGGGSYPGGLAFHDNSLAGDDSARDIEPVGSADTESDGGATATAAPDSDMDGIPDDVELMLGTDPEFLDSDYDGLTDHYELWGIHGYPLGEIGDLTNLSDPNGNGIIAPLDQGDMGDKVLKNASELLYRERVPVTMPEEGSMLPNDVDGDGIPNDFELFGFYFEIAEDNKPYFVRWPWWKDIYELDVPYYKTDPTQWSSDGDPFSDWEEATKINLDQRIKSPGDHPCIPAYPRLECYLTSYSINLMQDVEITSTSGGKTQSAWDKTTNTITQAKTSYVSHGVEHYSKVSGIFEATKGTEIIGFIKIAGPVGAGILEAVPVPEFTVMGHFDSETMYVGSASTANVSGGLEGGAAGISESNSGISAEEWSTATTTAFNTAEVASLILNLKIVNTGTMPATNARILFNLFLGDVSINSFVVPLEEFGEIQPMAANPINVVVTHDGRSSPGKPLGDLMVLSLDQLRSIESGVPLKIATGGFVADTLVWEVDPDTGRRTFLTMGPWAPYESSIQNSTAKIIIDYSNDPTFTPASANGLPPRGVNEVRVFCHSPNHNYLGSPPHITLTDALVWAFEATNSSLGPLLTVRDPISRVKHTTPIAGWKFAFDRLTLEKISSDPDYATGIFTLPLEPSNPGERVYICKAPPQGENAKPRIYWASCDPASRKIRAFSYDAQGVTEMRFKPDPEADYDGELMRLGFDPADPAQEFAYTYELPTQYRWTGFEQVVAVNRIGKRTVMNIEVVGDELGTMIDGGEFGVVWDSSADPLYTQRFSFSGGVITNPPFDLAFTQEFLGDDLSISIEPLNGGALHDALYVLDPDPQGSPPQYLLDYDYLRKQVYDPVQVLTELIPAGTTAEPPLSKTYAVRSQTGELAVFKPELVSVDLGGGQYRYQVGSIVWRMYEGI